MQFPVYFWIGPIGVHPHPLFEMLAYLVGGRVYLWQKARIGDAIAPDHRWWIVAAGFVGVTIGSKLLYLASDPVMTLARIGDLAYFLGGKSVLGGLVGGLIAVELIKRRIGVRTATGDLFAVPLCLGIAVGRIGCFLTGLDDHTHGLSATLPWAVDFGDGPRHPSQIYEIIFLVLTAGALSVRRRAPFLPGELFKLFMVGYASFRLLSEALKPGVPLLGLNAIQWTSLALLGYYAVLGLKSPWWSRPRVFGIAR